MWEALWWGSKFKACCCESITSSIAPACCPGPTAASYFDKAVGDEWIFYFFFYHTENNTQPALIILCRVCSLVNISGGISTPEWEALDTGKKTQAIPISGPITTDPLCAKKNTKGTKERTLCFRVVHSWAVCLSLSCPLKKCQEALCAGWWRHLVFCFFFSPDTRKSLFHHHASSFSTSLSFNMSI